VGRCFCVICNEYMDLAAPLGREGGVMIVLYGGNPGVFVRWAKVSNCGNWLGKRTYTG
jgi:hypothetical protein